jgi:hypothetical protein
MRLEEMKPEEDTLPMFLTRGKKIATPEAFELVIADETVAAWSARFHF